MTVVAITTIDHGEDDGSKKVFNIGDEVTGLTDEQYQSLFAAGAVVEFGKERKFTTAPGAGGTADEETQKRDEILARAAAGGDYSPATLGAISSNASDASDNDKQTIAQSVVAPTEEVATNESKDEKAAKAAAQQGTSAS